MLSLLSFCHCGVNINCAHKVSVCCSFQCQLVFQCQMSVPLNVHLRLQFVSVDFPAIAHCHLLLHIPSSCLPQVSFYPSSPEKQRAVFEATKSHRIMLIFLSINEFVSCRHLSLQICPPLTQMVPSTLTFSGVDLLWQNGCEKKRPSQCSGSGAGHKVCLQCTVGGLDLQHMQINIKKIFLFWSQNCTGICLGNRQIIQLNSQNFLYKILFGVEPPMLPFPTSDWF